MLCVRGRLRLGCCADLFALHATIHFTPRTHPRPTHTNTINTRIPTNPLSVPQCGVSHTLAISEFGTLWACGYNNRGQLGVGGSLDHAVLRPVVGALRPYRIVAAAAGAEHSMCLSSDGSLFTWGGGRHGQLGHPHLQTIEMMQPGANIVVDQPRKIDCLDPFKLQAWKRVTAISSGKWHCMAVTVSGELMAFGRNKCGELGLDHRRVQWAPAAVPMRWTGCDASRARVSQVACGAGHSLALVMFGGKLIPCAAGANSFGQLGQGDQAARARFCPVGCLRGADIVTLQAGDHNSAAIAHDGTMYLWGRNDCGQLGLGHDRSPWRPERLRGFKAVHPDRTLRKNKRSLPRMRRVAVEEPGDGARGTVAGGGAGAGGVKAFFRGAERPREAEGAAAGGTGGGAAPAAGGGGATAEQAGETEEVQG